MNSAPLVLVTSTTEIIRGVPRVRVNEAYTDALVAAGIVPVVLPPVAPDAAVRALVGVDGLVLTGGEDMDPSHYGEAPHPNAGVPHAARDRCELALCQAAHERRVPTLAICRGAQVVNVALGGSLVQDIPDQVPGSLAHAPPNARNARVHRVSVSRGSRLAQALGATEITANSSHHQSVDRLGAGLCANAHADDGIVEGLESADPEWWMVAVQWHPEELAATTEDWDRRLFAAFGYAIRQRASSRT